MQCKKGFITKDDRPNRITKYCSRACRDKGMSTRVLLTCVQCNQEFTRKAYMAETSRNRGPFCGFKCYGEWQHDNLQGRGSHRITVKCYTCDNVLSIQPSQKKETQLL